MKKLLPLSLLLLLSAVSLQGQVVLSSSFDSLVIRYQTPAVSMQSQLFLGEKSDLPTIEGYDLGGEVGRPALPVKADMLEVPFCDSIEVHIADAVFDTLPAALVFPFPLQPSRPKTSTSKSVPFFDSLCYASSVLYGLPLAEVEVHGIARDRRLASLRFSPVQVNPVTGQMVVCRSATVSVVFRHADAEATRAHFRRYHSLAFSSFPTLNSLFSSKDAEPSLGQPMRMMIVVGYGFDLNELTPFVEWKRQQGMLVDVINAASLSRREVADSLTAIYRHATDATPPPLFLLFVGDNDNLRSFDSRLTSANQVVTTHGLNDHLTDLYFTTWTDDILPDCYIGRFSAQSTSQLAAMVDKTVYYEKYLFADDSYLSRASLVAGVDRGDLGDDAYNFADPAMDYLARHYFNADEGFTSVAYYKNRVDYAPDGVTVTASSYPSSSASALRQLYNAGVGWANYSGHGYASGLAFPSFSVTHVGDMTNYGKPFFMVGNCCLTNAFQHSTCFGEALLRSPRRTGGVGYIGATNSTLWEPDFYWSVGYRPSIHGTMNSDYSANNRGAYDNIFHTHDEACYQYIRTAGAMVYSGQLVQASKASVSDWNRSVAEYYWEIYLLMGDPSLLPWIGRAQTLQPSLAMSAEGLVVQAAPGAYVALVDSASLDLLCAGVADCNGVVNLVVNPAADLSAHCLSITAQGYKPFFAPVDGLMLSASAPVAEVAVSRQADLLTADHPDLQGITLFDASGRAVSRAAATDAHASLSLQGLPAGVYLLVAHLGNALSTQKIIVQ